MKECKSGYTCIQTSSEIEKIKGEKSQVGLALILLSQRESRQVNLEFLSDLFLSFREEREKLCQALKIHYYTLQQ